VEEEEEERRGEVWCYASCGERQTFSSIAGWVVYNDNNKKSRSFSMDSILEIVCPVFFKFHAVNYMHFCIWKIKYGIAK
jgi:hypothetical protein